MNHFSHQISLETAVKLLAYFQYYSIPYLTGRGLPASHLRRLAGWIGLPNRNSQTIRQHKLLAAHIVLMQAANLLQHNRTQWFCSPVIERWLQQTAFAQYQELIEAIDRCAWESVAQKENLSSCFDKAYPTFVRQSLARQQNSLENPGEWLASWQSLTDAEWQLRLPEGGPPKLLFHLLQLGEWNPQKPIQITALSVANARQSGYGLNFMEYLLHTATQQPLTPLQQAQLLAWYTAAENYQIQAVYLLSSKQPCQLAEIFGNRRLSRQIYEQISPRHAIVSPDLINPLTKWLTKNHKFLQVPITHNEDMINRLDTSAYHWLGLKLLIELKSFLALPIPVPQGLLDEAAAALTPQEQTDLALMAQNIVQELKRAIRGKDAFFPAQEEVSQGLIDQIIQAIATESAFTMTYQALGEYKPTCREIQPLRLEKRGNLYYLVAYCYRAEANLTFRLDRISNIDVQPHRVVL